MARKKKRCEAKTSGKAQPDEAAVAEVIEWLRGRCFGMADLLEDALCSGNPEHQRTVGYLLASDIKDGARAAARVLKGEATRFEWERYEQWASPLDLAHLIQIRPLGEDEGGEYGDEERQILREAAALLEAKIAKPEAA